MHSAFHVYESVKVNYVDASPSSLDELTNMDVEMKVPFTERWAVIVLDTNILLEFLDIVQTFVAEVEQQGLSILIVIPGAVIHELDMQKNRERLSWFARRASTWLLKKVKERRSVKGQALNETCKTSGNWKTKEREQEFGTERESDGLILDCCLYFYRVRRCQTLLCSKDKLLAVEAESAGIPTLVPKEGRFCSRDLALLVFGPEAQTLRFSGCFPSNHGNVMEGIVGTKGDDDGMDIDDNSAMTVLVRPSHALDLLHLQVIEHFGELLLELAGRVAGPEACQFGAGDGVSRHAPGYAQKQIMFWTTGDALEYLNAKKPLSRSSPSVGVFLLRPYEGRGARRGQDWSRRDWEVVLGVLWKVGEMWAEEGGGICGSVRAVEGQMRYLFGLAMRPTGN